MCVCMCCVCVVEGRWDVCLLLNLYRHAYTRTAIFCMLVLAWNGSDVLHERGMIGMIVFIV